MLKFEALELSDIGTLTLHSIVTLCQTSAYAPNFRSNMFWQITYSIPYALVSSRIEALGLGQGGHY